MSVGIISDTHGLLRQEALSALARVELIIHAGDVGGPEILRRLKEIAPVFAVRGNVDTQPWAKELPERTTIDAAGTSFYVLHNLQHLDLKPEAAGFQVVVTGHTHQPDYHERNGVLYLNPGSAGPQRFHLPVTLAILDVRTKPLLPEILLLLS